MPEIFLEVIQEDDEKQIFNLLNSPHFSITTDLLCSAITRLPATPRSLFNQNLLFLSQTGNFLNQLTNLKTLSLNEQLHLLISLKKIGIFLEIDFSFDELSVLLGCPDLNALNAILPHVITEKNKAKFLSPHPIRYRELKRWLETYSSFIHPPSQERLHWIVQNSKYPVHPISFFSDPVAQSVGKQLMTDMETWIKPNVLGLTPDEIQSIWQGYDSEDYFPRRISSGAQASVYSMPNPSFVVRSIIWGDDLDKRNAALKNLALTKKLMDRLGSPYETGIIDVLNYRIFDSTVEILMQKGYLCLDELLPVIQNSSSHKAYWVYFYYDLTVGLVNALVHLKASRLIHSDIKFGNIMFLKSTDNKIYPCLIDLGSLTPIEDHAKRTLFGTIEYIAPESSIFYQHTYARDLWAVGYVLKTLLTGTREKLTDLPAFYSVNSDRIQSARQRDALFQDKTTEAISQFTQLDDDTGQYLRCVENSFVYQEMMEAIHKSSNSFETILLNISNWMLDPRLEVRPSLQMLQRILTALSTRLPHSNRPSDYGFSWLNDQCTQFNLSNPPAADAFTLVSEEGDEEERTQKPGK